MDCLEKENFNLRMKLYYQQESWAVSKSEKEMAKEIVELKVSVSVTMWNWEERLTVV